MTRPAAVRPPRVLPEAFESIIIRRIRPPELATLFPAMLRRDCDICGRLAHWQIVSKWQTPDSPAQWLTTYLCPVDGWEFVSALGDNLRVGDP